LLADILINVGAFLTALQAVTDLGCVKASIIIPISAPEWAETAGANVDTGATFSGWVSVGQKKASLKIPGIKATLVGADGSVADGGVTATFLDEFEDAADFNLSDGEQIDTWIRGALDR